MKVYIKLLCGPCNPPYGRGVGDWLKKALEADLAVFLLPSRTDTKWWHEYALKATEIRFIKGRLKFEEAKNSPRFQVLFWFITTYRVR